MEILYVKCKLNHVYHLKPFRNPL